MIVPGESVSPMWSTIAPPSRSSTSVGRNQELIPLAVAMASQTCSGVPGTSTEKANRSGTVGVVHVTLDDSVAPVEYNYRTKAEHQQAGTSYYVEGPQPIEAPGLSFFLRDGDSVFHTYSTYARGAEMLGGSYYFLDLTALGRQEDWEEPKGRADHVRDAVPDCSA